MQRVSIGTNISLSRIAYGMWRLTEDNDTSAKHIQAKIEACLAQGITTMDHADIYGGYTGEALLGAALRAAPTLRDHIEIVTKCDIVAPIGRHSDKSIKHYDTSAAHINASVDTSLREMAIDQIDLFLIHRPDPLMDHHETGACLDALVESGKARAVGVSNFRPWDVTLLQSAMKTRLVTNQIEISLGCHAPFVNGDVAFHQERGIPLMAWSPLGGGQLITSDNPLRRAIEMIATTQGVEPAAVAVAWLLRHPAQIIPVLGTNNLTRITQISQAFQVEMDRQKWFSLYTHSLGQNVA